MNGVLSNGLPGLKTLGNRIIEATSSAPVTLRGVNRSGLEYAEPDERGFLSAVSILKSEIEVIVREWGCNIIRLPFNQDFVLHGRNNFSGEDYQKDLDQVISWASMFGAYTLLDLQWLDADRIYGGNRNFVAPLPNSDSIELWTVLARRYSSEPAVLFDIFNEPHDRLEDDPYPLNKEDGTTYPLSMRRVTMKEWQPWARRLASTIRTVNRDALIFISGTNWGYDLRGMPMNLANVVYSTHVYANKGSNWSEAFGNLSRSVPVFVAEFGGHDTPADLEFGRLLIQYLLELGVGWTAWSWSDVPYLAKENTATEFGNLVRQQLRSG